MKTDFKKRFNYLSKKTKKEIIFNLKFFPDAIFLKELLSRVDEIIKVGKLSKKKSDFKKLYSNVSDIFFEHDDWMFDGRYYTKNIKKPFIDHDLKNKKSDRIYAEAECGDLFLRKSVDSSNDLLFLIKKNKKLFEIRKNKIKYFNLELSYTYPNNDEIEKLETTQKFGHYLRFNRLNCVAMSFNHYSDKRNKLIVPVDLLNIKLDFLKNFIKNLNKLKEIDIQDLNFYRDEDFYKHSVNQPFVNSDYSYDYINNVLKNPNFCNYKYKINNKSLIKRKLINLNYLRNIVDPKIPIKIETFLFEKNSIDYGSKL